MPENNNGFEDLAGFLNGINIGQEVAHKGLEDAAKHYVEALKPQLPTDPKAPFVRKYGMLKDNLKTKDAGKDVQVTFGDAFWWVFLEHGTSPKKQHRKGIVARNYAHNTLTAELDTLEDLMKAPALKSLKMK